MKKLYKKKSSSSSSVHPSPPLKRESDHLSLFLPAAIFTLTLSLSVEDKEVLSYLVSSTNKKDTSTYKTSSSTTDHPTVFTCSCFRCYMSYWVRWDSSPNRQLIHEIIDAFEEYTLFLNNEDNKTYKKDRKKKHSIANTTKIDINSSNEADTVIAEFTELTRSPELGSTEFNESESMVKCEEEEEGSVRKLVSFLGERIWSVWT